MTTCGPGTQAAPASPPAPRRARGCGCSTGLCIPAGGQGARRQPGRTACPPSATGWGGSRRPVPPPLPGGSARPHLPPGLLSFLRPEGRASEGTLTVCWSCTHTPAPPPLSVASLSLMHAVAYQGSCFLGQNLPTSNTSRFLPVSSYKPAASLRPARCLFHDSFSGPPLPHRLFPPPGLGLPSKLPLGRMDTGPASGGGLTAKLQSGDGPCQAARPRCTPQTREIMRPFFWSVTAVGWRLEPEFGRAERLCDQETRDPSGRVVPGAGMPCSSRGGR